jgi:hypothetical protein
MRDTKKPRREQVAPLQASLNVRISGRESEMNYTQQKLWETVHALVSGIGPI